MIFKRLLQDLIKLFSFITILCAVFVVLVYGVPVSNNCDAVCHIIQDYDNNKTL